MKTVHVKVIALFLCVSATVACSNKSSTKQTSPGQQQSSSSASQPQVQQSAETQPQQAPVQQASKAAPVNMAEKVSGAPAIRSSTQAESPTKSLYSLLNSHPSKKNGQT